MQNHVSVENPCFLLGVGGRKEAFTKHCELSFRLKLSKRRFRNNEVALKAYNKKTYLEVVETSR